ncbi:arginine-hydroxylase NDUFAF5, mitochondrial-like [Palaemon carinicauda]|uniref:arginine-hydroxylase NDUFAF5, mitochondrial-like n=1 Tax=Palaemon carinicauda TaxID=392227 RepID=UPI0035B5D71A
MRQKHLSNMICNARGYCRTVWRCGVGSGKMLNIDKRRLHSSNLLCRQQSNVVNVFDRHTKLLQRERAAKNPDVAVYDYLKEEVGYRLSDRILDIKKELKVGLDLGCGRGHVAKNIIHGTLEYLYMSDMSPSMVESAQTPEDIAYKKMVFDEEEKFPLETELFDLVISNLNLHWVNDLPGCMREINRVLKKDGVFLASVFGGDTLFELRSSLVLAELEREGGFAAHISPFTEIQDIGALLNSCGFTMLTIDTDEITVGYPTIFELMFDLQGMGESNASIKRKPLIHRDTLLAASAIYQEMYGNKDGIPATFQVIYMIGWKPDPSQVVSQADRGTGQVSLKDLHKLNEMVKEAGMEGRIKFMEELIDKKDK